MIIQKMKKGVQRYLVVQSEGASHNYDTKFVEKLFSEEGKGEVCHSIISYILKCQFFSSQQESIVLDMLSRVGIQPPSIAIWAQNLAQMHWNVS